MHLTSGGRLVMLVVLGSMQLVQECLIRLRRRLTRLQLLTVVRLIYVPLPLVSIYIVPIGAHLNTHPLTFQPLMPSRPPTNTHHLCKSTTKPSKTTLPSNQLRRRSAPRQLPQKKYATKQDMHWMSGRQNRQNDAFAPSLLLEALPPPKKGTLPS